MPCLLKIRIISARNLPVMDRKTELTDAYVEVRFADLDMQKTAICRQTLNPVWNEDFRLEVINDAILQNEPLELRILDYDAITADDVIGTVLLDLNPLLASLETPRPLLPPALLPSGIKSGDGLAVPATTAPDGLPGVTLSPAPNASLLPSYTGWLPVTHSLLGIRGEIQIQVRLQFFGDANPFKNSSAGVHIFSSTHALDHWVVEEVMGFVDALVVEDDPEYHWSDSFRTPRASNDARQKTFYRIAGRLRRLLGRKTLDRGGNAIIGFKQEFDIEPKEHVITARAIGTAVKVVPKVPSMMSSSSSSETSDDHSPPMLVDGPHNATNEHRSMAEPKVPTTTSQANNPTVEVTHVQSIPSTEARDTRTKSQNHARPKVSTTTTSGRDSNQPALGQNTGNATEIFSMFPTQESGVAPAGSALPFTSKPIPRRRRRRSSYSSATSHSFLSTSSSSTSSRSSSPSLNQPTIETWSQVIFTLHDFPPGALQRLGGVVSAKSVKLIEDDSEQVREMWWDEVREEIKSHARNLGFPHVIGYTETVVLTEEAACVLSAVGTAAALDLNRLIRASQHNTPKVTPELSLLDLWTTRGSDGLESHNHRQPDTNLLARPQVPGSWIGSFGSQRNVVGDSSLDDIGKAFPSLLDTQCGMCHIADPQDVSYSSPVNFTRCSCCKKKYVPEIILSTTEIPPDLSIVDMGCLVEAHVCRPSKLGTVDDQAAAISDAIPFVEYDLHRQLVYKLRVLGMNAIFNLKFHLTISEEWMISLASGTAIYITALPTPPPLRISRTIEVVDDEDRRFLEIQKTIMRLSASNRQRLDDAFRRKAQLLEWYQQRRSNMRRHRKPTISSDISQSSLVDDSELVDGRVPDDNKSMTSGASTSSEVSSQRSVFHPYQPERYFAVQVDDDEDEDLMAALLGVQLPASLLIVNTDFSSCFRQLQEAQHLRKVAVGDEVPTEEPAENDDPTSNDQTLGFIAHFYQNLVDRSGSVHPFTQNLTLFRQFRLDSTMKHPSRALVAQFTSLHETLVYRLQRATTWCMVAGVRYHLMIQNDQEIQLILHATALTQPLSPARLLGEPVSEQTLEPCSNLSSPAPNDTPTSRRKIQHRMPSSTPSHDSSWLSPFRALQTHYRGKRPVPTQPISGKSATFSSRSMDIKEGKLSSFSHFSLPGSFTSSSPSSPHVAPKACSAQISTFKLASGEVDPSLGRPISPAGAVSSPSPGNPTLTTSQPLAIKLCTLSGLPFVNTECYLGRISLHFIKEVTLHNETLHPHLASFDGFVYQFLNECQATLRAHVTALGGNALLSLHIDQCLVEESLKNHAYALISISGDVVYNAPVET
ncbi:hypothetical protein IWQ61_002673 [Dispira simplex]|nr:hypothetical protein IWQ61_002673 [Dispira simplex]